MVGKVEQWVHVKQWQPVHWGVLQRHPSLFVVEALLAVLFLVSLLHALRKGRVYLLLLYSSVVVGLFHEAVGLVLLPEIGSFFRAHAFVMLTPHLPLYTLLLHTCFLCCCVVSGLALQLGAFGNASFVVLLGGLFYGLYDVVGVKMLWRT